MAHAASTVLFGTIGDDVQLLALAILDDLGGNGSALHNGSAHLDRALLAHSEDLIELHFGVSFSVQLLDVDDVALLHAVLLTAGNDDCVHKFLPFLCTRWPSGQARDPGPFQAPTPSGVDSIPETLLYCNTLSLSSYNFSFISPFVRNVPYSSIPRERLYISALKSKHIFTYILHSIT